MSMVVFGSPWDEEEKSIVRAVVLDGMRYIHTAVRAADDGYVRTGAFSSYWTETLGESCALHALCDSVDGPAASTGRTYYWSLRTEERDSGWLPSKWKATLWYTEYILYKHICGIHIYYTSTIVVYTLNRYIH